MRYTVKCDACSGLGKVTVIKGSVSITEDICPRCHGHGEVLNHDGHVLIAELMPFLSGQVPIQAGRNYPSGRLVGENIYKDNNTFGGNV
jgi:hypothetical protein